MAELSVIIPALVRSVDEAVWLHEALLSVDNQSFTDHEIIVVDDGSPFANLHEVRERWPDVRWLQLPERGGPGAARNVGVGAAHGQWVLFLDADDRLKPNGIAKLYEKRCPDGYVYGNLEYIDNAGKPTGQGLHVLEDFSTGALMKLNGPNPITTLFHRSGWIKVGGFDETLEGLEDIEFWLRLAAEGICGMHIPEVTFEYRVHAGSRQQYLIENDHRKLKELGPRIRAKHENTWSRLTMANCKSCPGSTGPGVNGNGAVVMANGTDGSYPVLRYTGLKIGGFFMTGPTTQTRYLINGRGTAFACHPKDVDWFLSFRGGSDTFEVERPPKPAAPPTPVPPRISGPMPLPELPDITTLGEQEAFARIAENDDLLDLKIWWAEENGNRPPRPGVLDAITAKLRVKA